MGERTAYPHGTFSWVENSTTDQDGAKRFYASLFGWDYDDSPVGDGIVYSMAKLGDSYVAAISPQIQDERDQGIPPHWNNYVTVDDVDRVAGQVTELGGQLAAPPFDVMDVGRMAVIIDPTGAVLSLWQPRRHIGAGLVNVPGSFTWNELATGDPAAAEAFYSQLLSWEFAPIEGVPGLEYWTIRNGGRSNGGMRRIGDEMLPHWLPYFATDGVEAIAAKAAAAGGEVVLPRTAAGGANAFAVLRDPAGSAFGIAEGEFDD